MFKIAFRLLLVKRLGTSFFILGASLALLLISVSYLGQKRGAHWLQEIEKVDLWVYPKSFVSSTDLARLRSLEGVESISPFCQKSVIITLPNGIKELVTLLGVEELAFPRILAQGKLSHLQIEQSMIIDEVSLKKRLAYRHRGAKKSFKIGQYLLVGEHKMLLGGVCKLKSSELKEPLVYTSYSNAMKLFEPKKDDLQAYLIKAKPGVSLITLAETIERMFPFQVKTHAAVLANEVATHSSQTPFPFLITMFVGVLFYVATLWEIFTHLGKHGGTFRRLGASISFLTILFGLPTVVLFIGGWTLATGICLGFQLACQTMVPSSWGYSSILILTTFLISLGITIREGYVSYRL